MNEDKQAPAAPRSLADTMDQLGNVLGHIEREAGRLEYSLFGSADGCEGSGKGQPVHTSISTHADTCLSNAQRILETLTQLNNRIDTPGKDKMAASENVTNPLARQRVR